VNATPGVKFQSIFKCTLIFYEIVHIWQLQTVIFLHRYLKHAVLLALTFKFREQFGLELAEISLGYLKLYNVFPH